MLKNNSVYTIENKIRTRLEEIKKLSVRQSIKLDSWQIRHAEYISFGKYRYKDNWQNLSLGQIWGQSGETAFIKKDITLADCKNEYIALKLDTDGEGLLYVNGEIFHGVDDFRGYICLTPKAQETENFSLLIEHKAGGYEDFETKPQFHIFSNAEILYIDKETESIYYDYLVPFDTAKSIKDETLSELMLNLVYDSLLNIDFYTEREKAKENIIKEHLDFTEKLKTLPKAPGTVRFTGNSHIDLAFMWPERETHRKVGRTFSSLCRLMDEYPHYTFICSQVPLFEYLKNYYPKIYDKIKDYIKKGRFEPIGGTYVQNDTNIPCGESLVRQCLYGKRFFKNEFGTDIKIAFLPDSFGFSYTLPQIYSQAGFNMLITQKLRYNDTNSNYPEENIPELYFNWESPDGSAILIYNTGSYKHLTTENMDFMYYNLGYYYNKAKHLPMPEYLAPYGYGDGGGGVNRKELEYIKRLEYTPGFPKTEKGNINKFADSLPKNNINTYKGELYLEAHRGTYTSQAKIKELNRRCEIAARNAEILSVISGKNNRKKLTELWKKILFNQFHDILPGSSINEAAHTARETLSDTYLQLCDIQTDVLKSIAEKTEIYEDSIIVFNPLSFDKIDIIRFSCNEINSLCENKEIYVTDNKGKEYNVQIAENDIIFIAEMKALSTGIFYIKTRDKKDAYFTFNTSENNKYKITFGKDGYITSIYDKTREREILKGRSNVFQIFEDLPGHFDAWDIDPDFEKHKKEFVCTKKPHITEYGPCEMTVKGEYSFNNSKITQEIILYNNIDRIDFRTHINWQEEHCMLKVMFDTDINSDFATYEIPYGSIKRPTTRNNSYEKAKFEVCGHRWADLSEPYFGVSILNNSKYGWDIKDNIMRLTLLRSPKWPDSKCDMGEHYFTYSIMSHNNSLENTIKEAHSLNNPFMVCKTKKHTGKPAPCFLKSEPKNSVIDCIKYAEDSDDIIVRLYEPYGKHSKETIIFEKEITSVTETNILEENIKETEFIDNKLYFCLKPFEIKTFRIKL